MPCSSDMLPTEGENRLEKEVNKLTDMLCRAGQSWMMHAEVPDDIKEWWRLHQQLDARRGKPWGRKL